LQPERKESQNERFWRVKKKVLKNVWKLGKSFYLCDPKEKESQDGRFWEVKKKIAKSLEIKK